MASGGDVLASVASATLLIGAAAFPYLAFHGLFGAELAAPLGLALGALALPILLLYVLRPRRPRQTVASLLFWRKVAIDQQANSPFKRLRRRLTLLLQLLALAGLAYGLAGPTIRAAVADEATRIAVVVDVSASMLTRDADGQTRFEAAVSQSLSLIDSLGPHDQAMLVAAGKRPRIVCPWTRDLAALRRGLNELVPRHEAGRVDQALILVAASSPGERLDEVHLYSDGGGPPLGELELPGPLRYHPLGEQAENLGLTAVELRARVGPTEELSGQEEGLAYEVFASVLNAGETTRVVFVTLERDGQLLAARRLELPGGRPHAQPVVLEARLTPGPVSVRLLPSDGAPQLDALPVDDTAWLLVPTEVGAPVGLITERPSPALERALTAAGARLEGADAATPVRLVVCEQRVPDPLPPSDLLLIAPPVDVGPVGVGEEVIRPRVAGWDRSDPLLTWVDLHDLEIERSRRLTLGPGARALLQGEDPRTGEPVVLIASYGEGSTRRTVVGFDLYHSTWPLRASFPIFVRNCLERTSGADALAGGASPTGAVVSIPVPPGQDSLVIQAPAGRTHQVTAQGGRVEFADTWTSGVYQVEGQELRFCVNLVSPDESRIAPKLELELGSEAVSAAVGPRERPLEVGGLFALLALVVLGFEAWAYHRRW